MKDPNRLTWPPRRSDVLFIFASAVTIYAVTQKAWGIVITGLVVTAFATAFPRMKGPFRLRGSEKGPELRGELVRTAEEAAEDRAAKRQPQDR